MLLRVSGRVARIGGVLLKAVSFAFLLVCLVSSGSQAATGGILWRHELISATPGLAALAEDTAFLLQEGRAAAVGIDSGVVLWGVAGSFNLVTTADKVAYFATSRGVQARNVRDGTLLWQLNTPIPQGSTLGVVGSLLLHMRPGQLSPTIRAFDRHSGKEVWTWRDADAESGTARPRRLHTDPHTVIVEASYSGAYTYAHFTALDARTGLEARSTFGDKLFTRDDQGWVVAALAPNPFMPRMKLINGRTNEVTQWGIDLVRRRECGVGQPIGANRPIGLAADFLWLEVEDGCGRFLQRTSLTEPERAAEAPFTSEAGDTFAPTNSQSHVLLQRRVNRGAGTVGGEVMLLDLTSVTVTPLPSDIHHADQGWLLGELVVVRDTDLLSAISLPDATLRLQQRFLTNDWDVIGSTRAALVVRVGNVVVALRVPGRAP